MHSFIPAISIAPLQVLYHSEALRDHSTDTVSEFHTEAHRQLQVKLRLLLLLLLLLLSSFIGIRPTKQTADCKTHSNLAKTSRGRPASKEQWGTSDKCMNKNHNRIVGNRPLKRILVRLPKDAVDFHNLPNLRWGNRSSQLTASGGDPLLDCKKVRDLQHFRCKLCCSSHLICNKTILK